MRRLRYSVPYIAGKNLPKDSDPAPCGAGPGCRPNRIEENHISIHPPLAGRDRGGPRRRLRRHISIHPPLAGRDPGAAGIQPLVQHFNPPAPCGAGQLQGRRRYGHAHFNPPAPCGAGRCTIFTSNPHRYFNPPAPCGAGRPAAGDVLIPIHFNPPAPCGAGPGISVPLSTVS